MLLAKPDAPGRLAAAEPVAVVDIGSNSVRLVAYEGLTRTPTPIFNDKAMCALGKGVVTTGKLNEDGVGKALAALERFRVLCKTMKIRDVHAVATAAARDAKNGPDFLEAARKALGVRIELLAGKRESQLAALGVISGFYRPDGVVGDMGGGSLELNEVKGFKVGKGVSTRVGGLALLDASDGSPKKAAKIVREALDDVSWLDDLKGRTFYAIGGTWRALARLHMGQRNYSLHVMHGYRIPAGEAADFSALIERVNVDALVAIDTVSPSRRPLLAYGAVVLEEIIRRAKPRDVVISAHGLREGLLFERLDEKSRMRDPLIEAARELNVLRSRAPRHGEELRAWTDGFMQSANLDETEDEVRLRHAACLLADIGWRAHPDYRGEQSMNIIANAAFAGIDHPGRAFLALATSYRHTGEANVGPALRTLASARMLDRAHILGAAMRVAYVISAAMPDVLPRTPMFVRKDKVVLRLPRDLAPLANARAYGRLKSFARLVGRDPVIEIADSK
jgi:exopolyphosphatase / guanosine-5'-triphosphate,3'-diphosphate pyrophosphatase